MKHQIILVGGQLLPVFVGIKEFSPDKIHFIISEESKDKIEIIKAFFPLKSFSENLCNPFDISSIRSACNDILAMTEKEDEIQFNLTSGTKIMLLAAYAFMQENNIDGFYINPDNTILILPVFSLHGLSCEITVKEFLDISGHKITSLKSIHDIPEIDFIAAKEIALFADKGKDFETIIKYFRKNYNDNGLKVPKTGCLTIDNLIDFKWNKSEVTAEKNEKIIFHANSNNIRGVFFNSAWWELIVAEEISKWSKIKELYIQFELPFKVDTSIPKNEIDILINLGNKLIFIECKSGAVKAEDINKMRIIKDTYGGIISKSLLVSRFIPDKTIVEKCKELNIDIFYSFDDRTLINPLSRLTESLDILQSKLTI